VPRSRMLSAIPPHPVRLHSMVPAQRDVTVIV